MSFFVIFGSFRQLQKLNISVNKNVMNLLIQYSMRKTEETLKILPFEFYTKIQQAKPLYLSNLVNKELGYDVLVEQQSGSSKQTQQQATGSLLQGTVGSNILNNSSNHPQNTQPFSQQTAPQPQKIKNCISSMRPNSETFKRISKSLINNVRCGVDQLYLFCSSASQYQCRLESSIGLKTNPGLFIIAAISLLNQKYSGNSQTQSYQTQSSNSFNYDLEVSFTQLVDGNVYDLLSYTGQPLNFDKEYKCLQGQSYVKICTFKQFIKVFKVALFNNKERDFRTGVSNHQVQRPKSTFFMKLRSSLYNYKGELSLTQETVFIDYEKSQNKGSTQGQLEKNSQGKTTWDYIMMNLNNANPANKKMHYHLVGQNYLLSLLQKFFHNGKVTFINSLSADNKKLTDNLAFINSIKEHAGHTWQQKCVPFGKYNLLSRGVLDWDLVFRSSTNALKQIQQKKFCSIRELDEVKFSCITVIKKCKFWMKGYRSLLLKLMALKRTWKFTQNTNIADQVTLIGSCVKSDHFKDFYNAKSYLSLQREVSIKTNSIRSELKQIAIYYQQIIEKIRQIKSKQQQAYNSAKEKVAVNRQIMERIVRLALQFLGYFQSLQKELCLLDERTVADQVLRQQSFISQVDKINRFWDEFSENMNEIGSTNKPVQCQQENISIQGSYFSLLKQIRNQKRSQRLSQLSAGKSSFHNRDQKPIKKAFTKLPQIGAQFTRTSKTHNSVIKLSSVKLSSLLINPDQYSDQ